MWGKKKHSWHCSSKFICWNSGFIFLSVPTKTGFILNSDNFLGCILSSGSNFTLISDTSSWCLCDSDFQLLCASTLVWWVGENFCFVFMCAHMCLCVCEREKKQEHTYSISTSNVKSKGRNWLHDTKCIDLLFLSAAVLLYNMCMCEEEIMNALPPKTCNTLGGIYMMCPPLLCTFCPLFLEFLVSFSNQGVRGRELRKQKLVSSAAWGAWGDTCCLQGSTLVGIMGQTWKDFCTI